MVSSRDCFFARSGTLFLVLQVFGYQRDEGSTYDRHTELMERNAEAERHQLSSSWRWKVTSRIEVSITGWLSLEYVYSLDISGGTTLSVLFAWLMFLKHIWRERERAFQANCLAIPTTGVTRISVRLWIIDPPRSRQLNNSLRLFNY